MKSASSGVKRGGGWPTVLFFKKIFRHFVKNPVYRPKTIWSNLTIRQNVFVSSSHSNVNIQPMKQTSQKFDLWNKLMAQDKLK